LRLDLNRPRARPHESRRRGQATQDTAIGRKYDAARKMVTLVDIQRFPADCVNPPPGVKGEDWIKGGFAGAKCP
jgi:branched-chain amino acid transport system substrate-binding protein